MGSDFKIFAIIIVAGIIVSVVLGVMGTLKQMHETEMKYKYGKCECNLSMSDNSHAFGKYVNGN